MTATEQFVARDKAIASSRPSLSLQRQEQDRRSDADDHPNNPTRITQETCYNAGRDAYENAHDYAKDDILAHHFYLQGRRRADLAGRRVDFVLIENLADSLRDSGSVSSPLYAMRTWLNQGCRDTSETGPYLHGEAHRGTRRRDYNTSHAGKTNLF